MDAQEPDTWDPNVFPHIPDPWSTAQQTQNANAQSSGSVWDNEMWDDDNWGEWTGVTGGPQFGAEIRTAREVNYDKPPVWDGKNPQTGARPYMILLKGWIARTETKKKVRGMAILDNAKDDLRALIGTLEPEELLQDDADTKILELLNESYEQFLTQKLQMYWKKTFMTRILDARRVSQ